MLCKILSWCITLGMVACKHMVSPDHTCNGRCNGHSIYLHGVNREEGGGGGGEL